MVYLRAKPETLHDRIGAGVGRRTDATDLDWLRARVTERDGVYREMATLVVDTDELSPEEIAEDIVAALAEAPGRRERTGP